MPSPKSSGVWLPVQVMPDLLQDILALLPLGAATLALDEAAVREDLQREVDQDAAIALSLVLVVLATVIVGSVYARTTRAAA